MRIQKYLAVQILAVVAFPALNSSNADEGWLNVDWGEAASGTWDALANTDYYAAAGGSMFVIHDQVDADLEQSFDYGNLSAVTFRGGAKVHQYLSLEAEAAVGVFEHDAIELFSDSSVKLDSYYAATAVGRLPVTDRADITAKLGYSTVDIGVEFNDILAGPGQANQETDGVSYGLGFVYGLNDKWGVQGDVTVLQGNARVFQQRVGAVSLSVRRDF